MDQRDEQKKQQEDREKKRMYLTVADLSTMGFAVVLSIVVGLVGGIILDKYLGTEPLFTLLLIFGGILSGFRIMYKAYMRFFNEEKQDGPKK
jgi:F0F1-type ATP synthase assembly protein I